MTTQHNRDNFFEYNPTLHSFGNKNLLCEKVGVREIMMCLNLSQSEACRVLGVSLSTLKRRFYATGLGRWPSKKVRKVKKLEKSLKIDYVLNVQTMDEKDVSQLEDCDISWLKSAACERT
ncbi:NLP2 [Acrasis kona]|uniref:NLP2 n=1 Tax=Acrasis kona TaxID=1008807 RepID=A0AAW2ZN56_9EUKA